MRRARTILILMIVYAGASLLHFVHNALYIYAYPNLPAWITPFEVYASWCGITAVGVSGYWIYRRVSQAIGLLVIAVYALLGFGGLDHYVLAPIGAHTVAMNITIMVEVAAACILLVFIAHCFLSRPRQLGLR